MKKINIILGFFAVTLIGVISMSNSAGRAAGQNKGNTGAPGDEVSGGTARTCRTCHSGTNIGVTVSIEVLNAQGVDIAATGGSYVPGQTYRVKTIINHVSGEVPGGYGFQMVSLKGDNTEVNTWANPASNVKISLATSTNRHYPEHKGVLPNNVFEVDWTAPATGTGAISFYAAGVGVNSNGDSSGDGGSTQSVTIAEGTISSNEEVTIQNAIQMSINNNQLMLNSNLEINEANIEIFATDGKALLAKKQSLTLGNNQINLENRLSSGGVYFVRITDKRGAFVVKKLAQINL